MSSYLKTEIIECNSDFGVGTSADFTNTTAPKIIPKGSQISIDGSIVQQISAGTDNIIELSNRNGLNVDYVSSYNVLRVIYWISNNGNNGSTLPIVCVGEGAKDNNGAIITPAFFPNNIDMPNSPIISTDNYCYAIPIKSTIQTLPAIPSSVEGLYGFNSYGAAMYGMTAGLNGFSTTLINFLLHTHMFTCSSGKSVNSLGISTS